MCPTESWYGAARLVAVDQKKLRDRQKRKTELYADLGQDILRLAIRVSKGAPQMAEREAKDYFVRALPSKCS